MNSDEIQYMLKTAVGSFLTPETIRESESVSEAATRQTANFRDLLYQLKRFVSVEEYHEACLLHARRLADAGHHRAAVHAFLGAFWDSQFALDRKAQAEKEMLASGGKLAAISAHESGTKAEVALKPVEQRVRAVVLSSLCRFRLLVEADPHLESEHSVDYCLTELKEITKAMKDAMSHDEQLYYIVYNASVDLFACCQTLIRHGLYRQSAVFIGWCARCCDTVLPLATTKYLAWRVRLYSVLAWCYEMCGEYSGALVIAQQLVARVDQLSELEHLDVVPPSKKQLDELSEGAEAAKVLLQKYSWGAGMSQTPSEETTKTTRGGKGQTIPQEGSTNVPTPADILDKLKSIISAVHPGILQPTLIGKTVGALLALASDGATHIVARAATGGKSVPPHRAQLTNNSIEALWMMVSPMVEEYLRKNNLTEGLLDAEPPATTVEETSPVGKATKKDAKPPKGGKNAPAQKTEETEDPKNSVQFSFHDTISVEVELQICRSLVGTAKYAPFHRVMACLKHRLEQQVPQDVSARQEGQLLEDVCSAATLQGVTNDFVPHCIALAQTLARLRLDRQFMQSHKDVLEDAALLLLDVWRRQENSHEALYAEDIMANVAFTLMCVGYNDELLIGNQAIAAALRYEQLGRVDKAVTLMRRVLETLTQRQAAFVSNNDNSGTLLDTTTETFSAEHAVTVHDGIWLRTLTDMRTEATRMLARFRLQIAVEKKHSEMEEDQRLRVSMMKQREQNSHIFGGLSMKEKRAMINLEEYVVEKPCTETETELKLLAWAAWDPVAVAVALCEIALVQRTPREKRVKLAEALTKMQAADAARTALRGKLSFDEALLEPMTINGLSLYYGWALLAHAASSCGQHDIVLTASKRLFDRFVSVGDNTQKPWNRNICAWDELRGETVDRCSTLMLQMLSLGLLGAASARAAEIEYVPQDNFKDDPEQGLDPRRYLGPKVQFNRLRSANAALHALELAIAAADEPTVVVACHTVYNCMLPLLEAKNKSLMLLRPVTDVLYALQSLQSRRWQDGPLQLLAVRVLQAALDVVSQLPDSSQKSLSATIATSFCTIWKLVFTHPNDRQRRHISRVREEITYVRRILSNAKSESDKPLDAAEPEKGGKEKSAKKAPKNTQGAPAGSLEPPKTTVFLRADPTMVDLMPMEFLELLQHFCFGSNSALYVPTLEAQNEAEGGTLFCPSYIAIALAMQQSPQAAQAKLQELKGDIMYAKLTSVVITEMQKRRMADAAVALCQELAKDILQRHGVISAMEAEVMKQISDSFLAAAPTTGDAASRLSPRSRSSITLSQRVAVLRRKLAFRKIREWQRQYDMPYHALAQLQAAAAFLHIFAKEQQKRQVVQPAEKKDTTPGTAAAKLLDAKKKEPPPKKGGKLSLVPGETPREKSIAPTTPEEVSDPLDPFRVDVITAASKAIVLFARCKKWSHQFTAILFLNNALRMMLGPNVPNALADVVSSVIQQQSTSREETATNASSRRSSSVNQVSPSTQLVVRSATTARISDASWVKIEQPLKVVASQYLYFLEEVACGNASLGTELDFLHAPSVKTGKDCETCGGLLARTTSLHMWLSPMGQKIYQGILSTETEFLERIKKIFARQIREAELAETETREKLEKDWLQELHFLTGIETEEEETEEDLPVEPNRAANAKKKKVVIEASSAVDIPLSIRLAGVPMSELIRCFLYAVQGLQFGKRKITATQLCLECNEATRGAYAVSLLPFAINLQYATGANYEKTIAAFNEAFREQLRAQKLITAARKAWASYRESEVYKRVLQKLANTLQPSRKLDPSVVNPDMETMSQATSVRSGMGGPTLYREVVALYNTAITYLRQKHSLDWLVEMLFELGNLHLLHRVKGEAEKAWSDAVDAALGRVNVASCWRVALRDIGEEGGAVVQRVGFARLLTAVAALAKLGMFIYHELQTKATDVSLFAAELLWQLCSNSLSSPQRLWDVATASLRELLPGVDEEKHVSILPDLASGMLFVAHHLYTAGFPQQALVAATALEHLSQSAVLSTELLVQAKCVKAEASAAMGCFAVAWATTRDLLRGKSLVDRSFGQLGLVYDAVEKAERQNTGQGTRPPKGADAKAASVNKTKDEGKKDDSDSVEYDNSKAPTDEANIRVVEGVGALLNPQTFSLVDSVAAEYGSLLSRQVLLSLVEVCLHLGSADPQVGWISAAEAQSEAVATGAQAAGKSKTERGKGASEARADSSNACSSALNLAERILGFLNKPRPKSAPAQPAASGRLATPNTTQRDSTDSASASAEDEGIRQRCRMLAAALYRARGQWTKAADALEEIVATYNAAKQHPLSLQHVPSFTYSLPERFVVSVLLAQAQILAHQKRYTAASAVLQRCIDITQQYSDTFSQRDALERLCHVELCQGKPCTERISNLVNIAEPLDWHGGDGLLATALLLRHNVHLDKNLIALLHDPSTLQLYFRPPKNAVEELHRAVQLLSSRARSMGPQRSTWTWHAAQPPPLQPRHPAAALGALGNGRNAADERKCRRDYRNFACNTFCGRSG